MPGPEPRLVRGLRSLGTVRTLTVIQPDPAGPLDRFEGWLASAGVGVQVLRPFAGDPVPARPGADGLIVLGGRMSANDEADHPWLLDICRLLEVAVQERHPTLGICQGGQLLARALGGSVTVGNRGTEAGAVRIRPRPAAAEDPLFAPGDAELVLPGMHGDMIATLPPEAVWLAGSEQYPHQAFRIGPCAWGVQFHPEASPQTYATWADQLRPTDPAEARTVREGVAALRAADAEVAVTAESLATRFAQVVVGG